jgi:hypothetical protein
MTVQILVDGFPDDGIESFAWVEVTGDTPNSDAAVKFLESKFPLEDRDESERYVCDDKQEWYEPMGELMPDGRWRVFDPAITNDMDPRYGEPPTYTDYEAEEGPWVLVEPLNPGNEIQARHAPKYAKKFWVIEVVCPT